MFTNLPQQRPSKRESESTQKSLLKLPPTLSLAFRHLKYSKHTIPSDEYVVHRAPKIVIHKLRLRCLRGLTAKGTDAGEGDNARLRALAVANGTDVREGNDAERKLRFMELLGMRPNTLNPVATTSTCSGSVSGQITFALQGKAPGRKILHRRPRSTHQQVVSYFSKNPYLPISGQHGQKLIKESGGGLVSNPVELAMKVDKLLSEKTDTKQRPIRTHASKGVSKTKLNEPNQYIHKYHFGKRGRIQRNTELVLGVKTKDFPYLNMCKDLKIHIKALTKEEVAKALTYVRVLPKRYNFILKKCSVELQDMKDTKKGRELLKSTMQKKN